MSSVRRHLPDVTISLEQECVILDGLFPVHDAKASVLRHYLLKVAFPTNYPKWVPAVFMREPNIHFVADRHIWTNGSACLCLPHEIPKYLTDVIRFEPFLEKLLNPWLIGQAYYDEHQCWPWQERSHGKPGILEGFSELLGIDNLEIVENFAKLLVRKNPAKGHELCPCGSGEKMRNCHVDLYRQCREALPPPALQIYRNLF